jgi:ataxin 2/2L
MVHRVDENEEIENNFSPDSVYDKLIFKTSDIVSIVAKDVDLDYATSDTFPSDTAISKLNNGSRLQDRELEPWDASGGINGEMECNLELDKNSNGWDVNEMFHKNETVYGVQSTFDQSLAGYTVQIDKKNTQDFK